MKRNSLACLLIFYNSIAFS